MASRSGSGSKSRYEAELLAELKDLPEAEQAKLLRLIQFLKEEILSRGGDKEAILRHAGLLADLTPEEEERFTEAVRRCSLFGGRQVRL
jgi:hypothetical protein